MLLYDYVGIFGKDPIKQDYYRKLPKTIVTFFRFENDGNIILRK